ncbi:MAG: FtsX-like permease family protein [Bacteroidales bacterium]
MKLNILTFITRRLIFSNRNKGIVHIISLISLIGVAVGSFALVTVLSVFNGFTNVAQTMLEKTCPPLLIEPIKGNIIDTNIIFGKTIKHNGFSPSLEKALYIPVVKTTAMISVGSQRNIITLMGIDERYFQYNALDSCIVNGNDVFNSRDSLFCLMGINQAAMLGLNKGAEKMDIPVRLTVPATNNRNAMVIEDKLTSIYVLYQASYQTHSDLDEGIVFISLYKARKLLNMSPSTCNSVYVLPKKEIDIKKIQQELQKYLTNSYTVKTILEQEPLYFRIVKSEKLAVYIILAFIIFIASINIIGTIIILHIQKEKMNKILRTMGMRLKDLRKIYFLYGMSINFWGCLLGISLGLVVCFMQQQFGLIKLMKDAFVVDAFPIKVLFRDIIIVFVLVLSIGGLSIRAITSRIKENI